MITPFRPSYMTAWVAFCTILPVQPAMAIETATAHQTEVTIEAVFDGVIEAVNQTTVSAETAGQASSR